VEGGQLTRSGRTVANSQNSQLPRRRRSHSSATFFRRISINWYPAIDLHLRYPVNNKWDRIVKESSGQNFQ